MTKSRKTQVRRRPANRGMVPVPGSSGTYYSRSLSRVAMLSPITNDTTFLVTRRYNTTGTSGSTTISRGALLNSLGVATATNAGYRLANAVRIVKIAGWVAPATTSSYSNSCYFQWTSENTASKLVDLSAQQGQYGCYFESRPPKKSLAGYWSGVGQDESTVLLGLACLGGMTIDVTLEYTLMNSLTNSASALTNTISGATVGDVLVAKLDNLSGGKFTPNNQNSV